MVVMVVLVVVAMAMARVVLGRVAAADARCLLYSISSPLLLVAAAVPLRSGGGQVCRSVRMMSTE
ncbi:hypothetical protein V8C86DRAFT_1208842 [Haematococcus lacustris]